MEQKMKDIMTESIKGFKLPSFSEIPDVGLYLEQVVKFVAGYLEPLPNITITSSMISNYVKKGIIANPIKKFYNREQIAYIIFIAIAKTVLSLEDLQLMINLQKDTYESKIAYEYFCKEFENILKFVFGLKDSIDEISSLNSDEKTLLRNTAIAIAHKIYLDEFTAMLKENIE